MKIQPNLFTLWNFASRNPHLIKSSQLGKRKQRVGAKGVQTHAHFSEEAEGVLLHAGIFPKKLKKKIYIQKEHLPLLLSQCLTTSL